jgi:thymidylate synthase
MNKLDKQYTELLQDILDNGVEKKDRTGTGTISVFGRQIRHNMSEGFPLLTTKKMHWNSIVTELLWFLRGDTNIKFLLDYDCHIWDGDAYKNYVKWVESPENQNNKNEIVKIPESKEKFIKTIKCDDEIVRKMGRRYCENFAKQWGELGPIYGKQWRSWELPNYSIEHVEYGFDNNLHVDQIKNLIEQLKTNPDSRRLMVSAWNVGELDQMVLPPCHYGFQIYTRELSLDERMELYYKNNLKSPKQESISMNHTNEQKLQYLNVAGALYPIPTRAISLMWNQRSVDTFLGLPFNISSYGLLLEIIAKEVNMIPDELIGNLGDVHLYKNHTEQAKEQIGRDLTDEERYNKWFNNNYETGMERFFDPNKLPDFDNTYYEPTPTHTRQPFKLPTIRITERNWYQHELVKEHLGEKTLDEKLKSYRPDCFELIGYESHPKIKAHLSN